MKKDPAFLFYSKDFYEGTRLMLPDERACFIDLMIYQHQHGVIPLDLKRVLMYCSGVSEATLIATLEAKFKLSDKGWYNNKLNDVINERKEFSNKQSGNGLLGQFLKKAKSELKPKEYNSLKGYLYNEYGKDRFINELKKNETSHEAMLQAMLKHLVIENVIVNKDIINSNVSGLSNIEESKILNFSFDDFWNIYPVKGGKQKSFELFNKLSKDEKEKIKIHLPAFVKYPPFDGYNFPIATTYLNQKRFLDDIPTEKLKPKNNGTATTEYFEKQQADFDPVRAMQTYIADKERKSSAMAERISKLQGEGF